jgi:hypothetical protein
MRATIAHVPLAAAKRRGQGDGARYFKNASASQFPDRQNQSTTAPNFQSVPSSSPPKPPSVPLSSPPNRPSVPLSSPRNPQRYRCQPPKTRHRYRSSSKLQRREHPCRRRRKVPDTFYPPWSPRSSTEPPQPPLRLGQIVTAGPRPEGTSAGHGTRPIRAEWRSVVRSGSIPQRAGG